MENTSKQAQDLDVSIQFHQDRINYLKAEREKYQLGTDYLNAEMFEAITHAIFENEEIIRILTDKKNEIV